MTPRPAFNPPSDSYGAPIGPIVTPRPPFSPISPPRAPTDSYGAPVGPVITPRPPFSPSKLPFFPPKPNDGYGAPLTPIITPRFAHKFSSLAFFFQSYWRIHTVSRAKGNPLHTTFLMPQMRLPVMLSATLTSSN